MARAASSATPPPSRASTCRCWRRRRRSRERGTGADGGDSRRTARSSPRIYALDRLPQTALISPPVIPLAIDEDRRCAFDTVRDAALNVSFHTLGGLVCGHRLEIATHVHAGCRGPLLEVVRLEVILIGEYGVVHAPKGFRARERRDGLRRLRRHFRVRMNLAQREEAIHIAKGITVPAPQLHDDQLQGP